YYAIYRLSVDLYGRSIAMMVAVLAALSINYFTVMGFAICGFGVAENFMVFPAAAALLCYRRGYARGGARRDSRTSGNGLALLLLAGVFMGMDTCIKQTALPLVAAIVLHFSILSLIVQRSFRRWFVGVALLFAGGCIGWLPAGLMLVIQGTLGDAFALLTGEAVEMFGRASAWPSQWRDVLPLWVPLVWAAWAAAAWMESRVRGRAPAASKPVAPGRWDEVGGLVGTDGCEKGFSHQHVNDLFLLVLWCALEMYLIANLPLRSAHYYVASCVPFVVLSGLPAAIFAGSVRSLPRPAQRTAWTFAVIGSAVFCRWTIDEIVPRAISSYGSHDWAAESRRFDQAIHWGPIHFGRGAPFLSQ
ncbi:MAG: hypothetical protein V3W34_17475, partial [Phycisphaerae bacterium]